MEIYKNITIKPALRVDNSYIIGKAVVKDAKFSMEYVRKHAHIIQPNINQEIKEIIEDIILNQGHPFLVGGFVRDYFLKRESNDIDIEVFKTSCQI